MRKLIERAEKMKSVESIKDGLLRVMTDLLATFGRQVWQEIASFAKGVGAKLERTYVDQDGVTLVIALPTVTSRDPDSGRPVTKETGEIRANVWLDLGDPIGGVNLVVKWERVENRRIVIRRMVDDKLTAAEATPGVVATQVQEAIARAMQGAAL